MSSIYVYSFYRFKNIKNKRTIKLKLEQFISNKVIRGTILIANEGVNGSISGTKLELDDCIKFLKKCVKIKKLDIKVNEVNFIPFNRLRIRIKKEIVTLGQGPINVNKYKGELIPPKSWDDLIQDKNTKLIDVRNEFEIDIGKFNHSNNPKTKSFRDFPSSLKKMGIKKNDRIAMYCTGGIRCEKASAYLKVKGYKNVYQLEGGIIKYLEYKRNKNSLWKGECFVFDDRVTINKKLSKGKYFQCYGCRHPITIKEMQSKHYKKGVFCPYCYKTRTKKQILRSESRQKQINIAQGRKINHP